MAAKQRHAYERTKVNYLKTQAEIGALLARYGVTDSRLTYLGSQKALVLEFTKKERLLDGEVGQVAVRIAVPGVTEANRNQLFRALYYYLKSKFESLNFGFLEFTQEFFPHLVIPRPGGGSQTIYQALGQEYQRGLLGGRIEEFKLLPDGMGSRP